MRPPRTEQAFARSPSGEATFTQEMRTTSLCGTVDVVERTSTTAWLQCPQGHRPADRHSTKVCTLCGGPLTVHRHTTHTEGFTWNP